MKKIFLCSVLIATSILNLKAQTVNSKGVALSLGAGVNMPNTEMKNAFNMGNLTNFNLGVYVPLFSFGQAGNPSNFGLKIGGEYFIGNKDYNTSTSPPFNIMGQQSNPTIAAKGSGSPKQQGFKTELGVQANFGVGSTILSPSLNIGYLNFNQKAYAIDQNSKVNGQDRMVELYSQQAGKNSGVSFTPKFRAAHKYRFGRDNHFAIFAEGIYTVGPIVTTQVTSFKPNGVADAKGMYNIDQILSGKNIASTKNSNFRTFGVNVGVTFYLSKKGYDSKVANDNMASGTTSNPTYNEQSTSGTIAMANNPNRPKDNAAQKSVSGDGSISSIAGGAASTKAIEAGNNKTVEVKYNGSDQSLINMKLNVFGSGAILADGTPIVKGMVVSGQISGIDEVSRITIKQAESGDEGSAVTDKLGNFTISLGHDTLHKVYVNDKEYGKIKIESSGEGDAFRKGWDGTVKGGSKIVDPNEEVNNYRKGWDGTVKGGSKIVEPNEEMNAFVAGEPIGGIIVKGGRNPGGQMMTTTTNSNGEFSFEVKAAGDYLFQLTVSPELAANVSARRAAKRAAQQIKPKNDEVKNPLFEGSGTSGTNPMYQNFVAGEPIGGIIVKGGRNPGGTLLTITPNKNGELLLENLEPGNYKFIAITPNGKGITQSGIK